MKDKIMGSLKDHFRPEFLNRLDDIIVFNPLSREVIKEIVDIQLNLVRKRLLEKGIVLAISPSALDYLSGEGYSAEYGARPLKRLIQNKILNPVAEFIINRKAEGGGTVTVEMKDGEPSIDFKKTERSRAKREKLSVK